MSTFGGDSWVPEVQYRKRRVDELLGEDVPDDEVLRMSNGRFACLVCSQCPVLDTMPMLHVHRRGARHRAAAEKQLHKKQRLHDEIQKRIALGKMVAPTSSTSDERRKAPLFITTNDSKAKTLGGDFLPRAEPRGPVTLSLAARQRTPTTSLKKEVAKECGNTKSFNGRQAEMVSNQPVQQDVQEERKRRQQELRLMESGWKRDGNGVWYRDDNVFHFPFLRLTRNARLIVSLDFLNVHNTSEVQGITTWEAFLSLQTCQYSTVVVKILSLE